MRDLKLDINRFEYHDNVAVDCHLNMQEKEMVVYFDYYHYIESAVAKTIDNPIRFIIKGWSEILYHEDLFEEKTVGMFIHTIKRKWLSSSSAQKQRDEEKQLLFHDLDEKTIQIYEILNLEQRDDYVLLHIEGGSDDKEFVGFLKFCNATVSLEEIDMSERKNVFLSIDEIEYLDGKEPFVATIPNVANKDEMTSSIRKQLRIPNHISCTWENLADLFSDIYWLDYMFCVIVHEDLSAMPQEDLYSYFGVISKCRLRTLRTFFVLDNNTFFRMIRND